MTGGYLIPENAQPADTRCLRVFVPNDPLYMAALLGTLTYLGQWTAWERDASHRGSLAAHAWREANELTLDGLSKPCGDYQLTEDEMSDILDKLEEINNRLSEIEDMNVTVTQTVNGCGCGEGTTTTNQTDGIIIDPDDTGMIPSYMTDNITVIDSTRCRAANWMAVTVAQMTRTMSTIGTMPLTLGNIVNMLVAIFTIGNGIIWSMTAILALGYRLINLLSSDSYNYFDTVADAMEGNMESFVCAVYNWTSADNLGTALNGAISGFVNDAKSQLGLSDSVADNLYTALADVMGAAFVNYFVENIETIVPAGFVAHHDCLCGATGDNCPTNNLVLAGVGSLPSVDLSGTTQGFASEFNSQTGYHEIIFELSTNYCVTIDNGSYTPTETHEKCAAGVMVSSDGSCIRRFVARSLSPFATAVEFNSQTVDCNCQDWSCLVPAGELVDLIPSSFVKTESQCDNVSVDSFVVTANRMDVQFTVTPGTCSLGNFSLTLSPNAGDTHIRGWLFEDVSLSGPTSVVFNGKTIPVGTTDSYFTRTNSDWEACILDKGYVLTTAPHPENGHTFDLRVSRGTVSRTYNLSMTFRAINDPSL